MKEIKRLQHDLSMLRSCFGLSQEKLGNMLGMTRQNVWNLEHGVTKMSKSQYIAIRLIFDYLIDRRRLDNPDYIQCLIYTSIDDFSKPVDTLQLGINSEWFKQIIGDLNED